MRHFFVLSVFMFLLAACGEAVEQPTIAPTAMVVKQPTVTATFAPQGPDLTDLCTALSGQINDTLLQIGTSLTLEMVVEGEYHMVFSWKIRNTIVESNTYVFNDLGFYSIAVEIATDDGRKIGECEITTIEVVEYHPIRLEAYEIVDWVEFANYDLCEGQILPLPAGIHLAGEVMRVGAADYGASIHLRGVEEPTIIDEDGQALVFFVTSQEGLKGNFTLAQCQGKTLFSFSTGEATEKGAVLSAYFERQKMTAVRRDGLKADVYGVISLDCQALPGNLPIVGPNTAYVFNNAVFLYYEDGTVTFNGSYTDPATGEPYSKEVNGTMTEGDTIVIYIQPFEGDVVQVWFPFCDGALWEFPRTDDGDNTTSFQT